MTVNVLCGNTVLTNALLPSYRLIIRTIIKISINVYNRGIARKGRKANGLATIFLIEICEFDIETLQGHYIYIR